MLRNHIFTWNVLLALAMPSGLWLAASPAVAAQVSIASPQHEETVHNNSGNVTVKVEAQLDRGQRLRLLLDDAQAAPDSTEPTFALQGINRGEHTLKALVLDRNDNVIAESQSVTFFMWQASRLFPSR